MMIYSILSMKRDPGELTTLLNGIKGISGVDLFSVSRDQLTAVVSDTGSADLFATKSNVIDYARIIETLALQYTLLPMRYGSIMESNDAIVKMLERNYQEIQQNLLNVENKVEYGLKVFCDPGKLRSDLIERVERSDQQPMISARDNKNSVFKDYVNKKLREYRIDELMLTFVDSVITGISGYLVPIKAASRFKKMASGTTIIDAVFLLDHKDEKKLIHATENFKTRFPELNFVLTGPWPPYNFVETAIK